MEKVFGYLALFLLVSTGCAPSHTSAAADAGDEASIGDALPPALCATDSRAQSFVPGMEQAGKAGLLKARLLTMAPAPVAKGDNAWTIQLVDAKGAPVDGATLSVKPYMPDHGHGSSILPLVTPTSSEGKYTVTRLNLFMPGIWEITLDVTAPSADSIVFTFCVAG